MSDRHQTTMRFDTQTLDSLDLLASASGGSRTATVTRLIRQAAGFAMKDVDAAAAAGVGYDPMNPCPFNSKLKYHPNGPGQESFVKAAINVNDTLSFAIQSMRGMFGENFKHSDCIELLKMMMAENARLEAIDLAAHHRDRDERHRERAVQSEREWAEKMREEAWDRDDANVQDQRDYEESKA